MSEQTTCRTCKTAPRDEKLNSCQCRQCYNEQQRETHRAQRRAKQRLCVCGNVILKHTSKQCRQCRDKKNGAKMAQGRHKRRIESAPLPPAPVSSNIQPRRIPPAWASEAEQKEHPEWRRYYERGEHKGNV